MSAKLSLLVAYILDLLGYSEEARKWRIQCFSEQNFVIDLCSYDSPSQDMISGSKAEGTSLSTESDYDFLLILNGVKATEYADVDPYDKDLIFLLDCTSAPPGYCKLQLLQGGWDNNWHWQFCNWNCYVKSAGSCRWQLSSTKVVKGVHAEQKCGTPISGPSSPMKIQGYADKDFVLAIRCINIPSPLKPWFTRHREQRWPAPDLLQQLSLLPVYVVPVGMTGCEEKYLQWRISFNMMEKMLIHNLNNTQCKVYILLKMIIKEVVEAKFPNSISSYIVKTLVFWSIELSGPHDWTECNLLNRLLSLIKMLQQCVQNGNCPNYFIPDNNLLHGKLTLDTRCGLSELLITLLQEGPSCVLRCIKISQYINLLLYCPVVVDVYKYNKEDIWQVNHNLIRGINIDSNALKYVISKSNTKPFRVYLSHIVSTASATEGNKKKMSKYVFHKIMMQQALYDLAYSVTCAQRNMYVYRKTQESLRILKNNSQTDILSGKILLAQALRLTGQNDKAQAVLMNSFTQLLYYTSRITHRLHFSKPKYHPKLRSLLESDSLDHVRFKKQFTQCDLQFVPSVSACLPKAVQYEVYRTCDGKQSQVFIDSDFLGYYLQYLCHKELGQQPHADAALSNLVWCATQWESDIEYREVALNVLGHCFMEMKKYRKAVKCLVKSVLLTERYPSQNPLEPTGNAAVWHIAILLGNKFRHR